MGDWGGEMVGSPGGGGVMKAGGVAAKTVLITGVSKGLGRALAVELTKRGHSVVGCARSQDKLASLLSDLSHSSPPPHLLLPADVVCHYLFFFLGKKKIKVIC